MPEQISTLTIKYGGETMEKERNGTEFSKEGKAMDKELLLTLKDNLVITSLDGEGLVFEADTYKTFWVNETAVFLLKLLEANREGVLFTSVRNLLQEQYLIGDEKEIAQDFTSFIEQLERYRLILFQWSSNGTKIKNSNGGSTKKPYLKPIIEEGRIV